jgi:hypothetical protein
MFLLLFYIPGVENCVELGKTVGKTVWSWVKLLGKLCGVWGKFP